MGHAAVDNATPFAFEAFFLMDEDGRALCVPLLKASYAISGSTSRSGSGRTRRLVLADEQSPIEAAGRQFAAPSSGGAGADASYLLEPECATFVKLATDVAVVGHAVAPAPRTTEMVVSVKVGPLEKRVAVRGDRFWTQTATGVRISAPLPFERIPLVYERALGGWDRSDPDPERHRVEPRNPAGVGFRGLGAAFVEGPLPNLEDPAEPLERYGQTPSPAPACFGFVSPGWEPRAALAGTLDGDWQRTRMPLLPRDFDRRFFNAGSPGLIADGYLAGGEEVLLEGVSEAGPLAFELPKVRPPRCRMGLRRRPDADVAMNLDTVVIDTDALRVYLLWRGHQALPESAHDVRWLSVG
jgi:hypothetical protein